MQQVYQQQLLRTVSDYDDKFVFDDLFLCRNPTWSLKFNSLIQHHRLVFRVQAM